MNLDMQYLGKNKSSGNIYISQVESEERQWKETEIKHTDIYLWFIFFSVISGQRWIKVRPYEPFVLDITAKLYSLSPLIQ